MDNLKLMSGSTKKPLQFSEEDLSHLNPKGSFMRLRSSFQVESFNTTLIMKNTNKDHNSDND